MAGNLYRMCRLLYICSLLATTVNPAHAYLDPGTGSILISTVIAVVSTVLFVAKDWFYKIFKGKGLPTAKQKNKHNEIIIWSEAKHYWSTFAPMVSYLQEQGIPFTYLASDKNDEGLKHTENNQYIGASGRAFAYLNQISAHVMVMTTSNLGDLAIKRSKNVNHYVHVVHAPTDMHFYRRAAFECFDTVMCAGDHQIKTLSMLEEMRHTDKKDKLKTGCLYYDGEPKQGTPKLSQTKTVLIAPAWGKNNILHQYKTILPALLDSGFNIIIRPHPQSFKSEKKLLKTIMADYPNDDCIVWDKNPTNTESCQKSDVMISHLSGVMFDYAFVHQKPVLVIDTPQSIENFEAADLPHHPAWEVTLSEKLFPSIKPENLDNLVPALNKAITKKMPPQLGKRHLYNFQKAGAVAGQQLIDIYNKVRNYN